MCTAISLIPFILETHGAAWSSSSVRLSRHGRYPNSSNLLNKDRIDHEWLNDRIHALIYRRREKGIMDGGDGGVINVN